ncbi:MAG: hypothetical protein ACJAZS_000526 [Alteromonas naphthalenivorans]
MLIYQGIIIKRLLLTISFCISLVSTSIYSSEPEAPKAKSKIDYKKLARKLDKFGINPKLPQQLKELETGLVCKECEEARQKAAAQAFCKKAK